MWLEFFVLGIVTLFLCYRWITANYDFFERRGIPFHKPFPLLGSMKDLLLQKKSVFDLVLELYRMHDSKIYGVFDQRRPVFLLRDPELIKLVTIKDFDHFMNHRNIFGDAQSDGGNLFADSLFLMENEKWKHMRSTLSPVFTGSKMRQMFQLMNQVAQHSLEYLKHESAVNTTESFEFEFKEFCTRYSNDVIASTAFGLQVNSFKNKENEFYLMGKKVTTFTVVQNLKMLLYANFKPLAKLFKIKIIDSACNDYFMRLVLDAMKYRKEHNIFRPDMINLLMEARGLIKSDSPRTHNREWNDIEVVAQCFLFFVAGFDTTATLMSFAMHELMENPDVQTKLLEEIREVDNALEGEALTYEALQGMKYMDMVISEVLRKWPPSVASDRVCNNDIVYMVDGQRVEIKKGESISLPICGLHHDSKYFENPNKFDPERFSEENKEKIQPFTYFPFGMGPRSCIASRFALLEVKSIIFYLVRDFSIEAAKKTIIPVQLSTSGFQLGSKNGFWLKFTPRN